MTLRSAPVAATWFLKQFGSNTENESVIGDLFEQYQRGRGSIWYWRQVLAIVFMGLFREIQSDKRLFLGALIRTWCLWGGLQFASGVVLLAIYVLRHPEQIQFYVRVYGFPLLALHAGMRPSHPAEWNISLLSVSLNLLTLAVVGRVVAVSSGNHSKAVLLMFVTTFVAATAGSTATQIVQVIRNQPDALAFLLMDLVALPLAPALLFVGGMRGLSPASPHFKH